jgi:hypothetical protein
MSIFEGFDPNAIEAPKSDFELLPPQNYSVRILEATESETRNGDPGIKIVLEVTDGEYMNRRIFERCWIGHSSEKFAGRERQRFAALCRAVGWTPTKDSSPSELLGLELVAKVKIEKSRDPQYDDQNRVQDYFASTASVTPSPSPAASADKPKRAGSGDWKTQ